MSSSSTHGAKLESLRARHPRLRYDSCWHERAGDTLRFGFRFVLEPDLAFAPTTVVSGLDPRRLTGADEAVVQSLVFHIGLIELLSYWKAACPPEIEIRAGAVDDALLAWLSDLSSQGMREFFYVNGIDFRRSDLVRISRASELPPPPVHADEAASRDLLLLSGGRDSALALRLLREAGADFDCLVVNDQPGAARLLERYRARPVWVKREIAPELLELNRRGYLNGHTPFSAYLAVLGVTVAAVGGYRHVIVANERSSDFPHAEFLGEPVNHQYSKSFAFERGFSDVVRRSLSSSVTYFSLLRPLYEIQISRLFAAQPEDVELVRSCNRTGIGDAWCCRCAKCVSSFALLYPYADDELLRAGFGGDPYAIEDNAGMVERLLSSNDRPFECVATPSEVLAALHLGWRKARRGEMPVVLSRLAGLIERRAAEAATLAEGFAADWSDEHLLPARYERIVRGALAR
jgi:UDP-N-acetyl-alpha-D-muramoyl-L-alanyl-L-glutamate epimerase